MIRYKARWIHCKIHNVWHSDDIECFECLEEKIQKKEVFNPSKR